MISSLSRLGRSFEILLGGGGGGRGGGELEFKKNIF